MKSVIVGASAGLGRALAEELAALGHDLFLVATDKRDLETVSADLEIRFGVKACFLAADILNVSAQTLHESCVSHMGKPDCLFLVSGQSDLERDFAELSEDEADRLARINFVAPAKIAMVFLPDLIESARGALVGVGTVAQARPRAKNTVYAASKQALEFFFGGLRQKLSGTQCRVQYYRIGYMATRMTFGRKSMMPHADPATIAHRIVMGLGRDRIGKYVPWWWAAVMFVYRSVPWFVFRNLRM